MPYEVLQDIFILERDNGGIQKRKWGMDRINGTTTSKYNIYIYGADITVTYEYEDSHNQLYLKGGSQWNGITSAWKKTNGIWVEQTDVTDIFNNGMIYING